MFVCMFTYVYRLQTGSYRVPSFSFLPSAIVSDSSTETGSNLITLVKMWTVQQFRNTPNSGISTSKSISLSHRFCRYFLRIYSNEELFLRFFIHTGKKNNRGTTQPNCVNLHNRLCSAIQRGVTCNTKASAANVMFYILLEQHILNDIMPQQEQSLPVLGWMIWSVPRRERSYRTLRCLYNLQPILVAFRPPVPLL